MPLYIFRCKICALEIEDIQPTGCGEIKCTFCGGRAVRAYDKQTVRMIGDIEPRFDESLGVNVGSRREYREQLAYQNAYSPDLFMGSNPSDGRLTREERDEVEGRQVAERGTIFEKRKRYGWASNPSGEDSIVVEGEADYEPIKQHIKSQHERRRQNGK
jgi:hypothetical protein